MNRGGSSILSAKFDCTSSHHSYSLDDGRRWAADFECGGLRDIGSELWSELRHVVGEERRLVAGAAELTPTAWAAKHNQPAA